MTISLATMREINGTNARASRLRAPSYASWSRQPNLVPKTSNPRPRPLGTGTGTSNLAPVLGVRGRVLSRRRGEMTRGTAGSRCWEPLAQWVGGLLKNPETSDLAGAGPARDIVLCR
jgi:hypothetical protein